MRKEGRSVVEFICIPERRDRVAAGSALVSGRKQTSSVASSSVGLRILEVFCDAWSTCDDFARHRFMVCVFQGFCFNQNKYSRSDKLMGAD